MPINPLTIKTLLGRFSSKKEIVFPIGLSREELELFVDKLSDQEKIELYCLSEFLVFERITNEETPNDFISLVMLEDLLSARMRSERMTKLLLNNGLRTSIDRIRLGRSLKLT